MYICICVCMYIYIYTHTYIMLSYIKLACGKGASPAWLRRTGRSSRFARGRHGGGDGDGLVL